MKKEKKLFYNDAVAQILSTGDEKKIEFMKNEMKSQIEGGFNGHKPYSMYELYFDNKHLHPLEQMIGNELLEQAMRKVKRLVKNINK